MSHRRTFIGLGQSGRYRRCTPRRRVDHQVDFEQARSGGRTSAGYRTHGGRGRASHRWTRCLGSRSLGTAVATPAPIDGSLRLGGESPINYLPLQGSRAKRPPKGTIHVRKRYVKHYRAKRATWNDVINSGKRLNKVSSVCKKRWRKSGKDRRLNWRSADYRCMSGLKGRGYRPQGIAGSATTRRYTIGIQAGRPAQHRSDQLVFAGSRARTVRPQPAGSECHASDGHGSGQAAIQPGRIGAAGRPEEASQYGFAR